MTSPNENTLSKKTIPARPKQRITPRAMLETKRISMPRLHPDGQRVAFVVTEADFEESRWVSHLWLTEWTPPAPANSDAGSPQSKEPNTESSIPNIIQNPTPEPEDRSRQLTFSYEGEHLPRWSPDGRYLAFLSARPDDSEPPAEGGEEEEPKDQVWILPGDGGEARKITEAKEAVLDYIWTHDGKEILYLTCEPRARPLETTRKEERERQKIDPIVEHDDRLRRQVWRVDVEEKKPKRIFTGDYGISELALSPDANRLAYLTNYTGFENDYHRIDLFVRNLTDNTETKLCDRLGGKYNLHWSPDGNEIAFLSWLDPELSYSRLSLFVVSAPALTSPPTPLPPHPALPFARGGEANGSPSLPGRGSGGGSALGEGSESTANSVPTEQAETPVLPKEVGQTHAPTDAAFPVTPFPVSAANEVGKGDGGLGEARLVTDFDTDLGAFGWSPHNRMFYALAAVGTGSNIVRIQPDGRTKPIFEEPAERSDIELSVFNSAFVYVQESANALPEVFLRDDFGRVHQLTRLNAEFSETYRLPRQEVISWKSPDGTPVEGVLTYPLDFQEDTRYPLVVQVHGGPKGRATNTLRSYSMPVVWSAEGYAVLQPNFRGSEGYGQAFAVANRRDLGGGDFQDILSGVDKCIEMGLADPDQLGIMGGSYGGYMTNWAVGHTDRFKGAVSMFGIFHLQTDYSNSELSGWDNDYLGAYYWQDPEIYRKLSPGSYIENIKTPTLIIHGDDDDNTFISNSKELYQALRHRGVTTQFVHYPREGHGLREPNHKLDEMRRCLAWMDRYVRHGGENPGIYRVGDRIPHADGRLELCVTRTEITLFVGQPKPEKSNGKVKGEAEKALENETGLLEVQFTLHNPDSRTPAAPITLTLNDVRLEDKTQPEPLLPVGVPLDVAGVKVLLEGDNLRLVQHPDPDTGHLAFGFAVVFRVSKSGGDCLLRVADFPPVAVLWAGDSEEDEEEKEE
jgi:dipeptidyl aminopeptidase/acylaminoacyl peptidase